MSKRDILIGIGCFTIGAILAILYYRGELKTNKKLTARILSNSVKSMEASKELAYSCSNAYNIALNCASNISTCNIEAEANKLDKFNYKRGQAEEIIDWMSDDMKEIIEEVKTNR